MPVELTEEQAAQLADMPRRLADLQAQHMTAHQIADTHIAALTAARDALAAENARLREAAEAHLHATGEYLILSFYDEAKFQRMMKTLDDLRTAVRALVEPPR